LVAGETGEILLELAPHPLDGGRQSSRVSGTLRPIKGLKFVEETITALGSSIELATHLFRECWAAGTGSDVDLCRAFGWEVEAHKFKVATAADLVALWHNGRITVDPRPEEVSAAHARSVAAS
jgi:hypothetical protein